MPLNYDYRKVKTTTWEPDGRGRLTEKDKGGKIKIKIDEQQVFNQTLEIATDFIGMLRHSSRQSLAGVNDINLPVYFTQDQFTLEPFQERFDNLLCGYVFQVGIKVMNDFDTCTIPVENKGAGY